MKNSKIIIGIPILIVLLIMSCTSIPARESPEFQDVIELQGMSKAEIYNMALLWTSDTFKSAKSAIEIQNPESGLITAETRYDSTAYVLGMLLGGQYYTTFKVQIEAKDDKVRITCKNPDYRVVSEYGRDSMQKVNQDFVDEYKKYALIIIRSFGAAMKSEKNSNW